VHVPLLVFVLVSPRYVTVGVASQLSVAVASDAAPAGGSALHSAVVFAGTVNTGAVTSSFQLTVRDVLAVLPQASVALNVLVCVL
jgi:hypothetical protein